MRKATVSGYPYMEGKDFRRLVKLTRAWKYATHGLSRRMLSAQCEHLYYSLYGHVCYFDNF
jgi:hypothetical protein